LNFSAAADGIRSSRISSPRSFRQAAERTQAWIVTGGTHAGVMEMVGKILQESDSDKETVCLGIASWGATFMHEQAREARCEAAGAVRTRGPCHVNASLPV
jgi:metal-dependent hydrolase (beta-lactamase superfamily II)